MLNELIKKSLKIISAPVKVGLKQQEIKELVDVSFWFL